MFPGAKHLPLDTIPLKLARPDFTLVPHVCPRCLAVFDIYRRPEPSRAEHCPECGAVMRARP
jgi:hypothetical protein